MNVVDMKPYWDYDFFTVQPMYTVSDWARAKPIMADFLDRARTERGTMYSGWTVSGDKLFCREAYHDADAVIAHAANVAPAIDRLLDGAATLDSFEVHGPAADLAKCADAMSAYNPERFEIVSGCTTIVRPYAGMMRGQAHFSMQLMFTVTEWEAARPLLDECVARTKATDGSIFYGWTRSGDRLFCRNAFTNAATLLAHLASVDEIMTSLLDGPATLESVSVHGPRTRLDECRAATTEYHGRPTAFFAIDSGFQKYEITGYNLGMLDYSKFG
jgi:quinol monooxygenase YgiN